MGHTRFSDFGTKLVNIHPFVALTLVLKKSKEIQLFVQQQRWWDLSLKSFSYSNQSFLKKKKIFFLHICMSELIKWDNAHHAVWRFKTIMLVANSADIREVYYAVWSGGGRSLRERKSRYWHVRHVWLNKQQCITWTAVDPPCFNPDIKSSVLIHNYCTNTVVFVYLLGSWLVG